MTAVPTPDDGLRAAVEALVPKWSGCWCDTQMAYDHDPRVRDCPQHGDATAQHVAEGITSDLRDLLAAHAAPTPEADDVALEPM